MIQYLNSNIIKQELANLTQVVFEVTDACNLKCTYCAYGEFYEDYDTRKDTMLSVDKAILLLNYLTELWNSDINISEDQVVYISFYGGEPLINMPFVKTVVNYITNELSCPHRKFIFSMTTNAMLLDKYMGYLVENTFVLLISLDGDKNNNGYRVDHSGKLAFDRIISNINHLKQKYPRYFENYVNFNSVLHNKNSVDEIYHFIKKEYNKIPGIGELNNVGIRKDKQKAFSIAYKNTQESLKQAEHYEKIEQDMFINSGDYKNVLLYLHQYSGYVFKDYTYLLFDKSKRKYLPTGTCIPFSKKLYVTVNAKILPCERIGHQFALGDITDKVNLDFESIAQKYNAYYAKFEKQCQHCKNIKICKQCMFNVPDLDNKPVCNGYMNEDTFNGFVNAQMKFLEKHPEAYKKLMEEVFVI